MCRFFGWLISSRVEKDLNRKVEEEKILEIQRKSNLYGLTEEETEIAKSGEYEPDKFEEDEVEDDDFYSEDGIADENEGNDENDEDDEN